MSGCEAKHVCTINVPLCQLPYFTLHLIRYIITPIRTLTRQTPTFPPKHTCFKHDVALLPGLSVCGQDDGPVCVCVCVREIMSFIFMAQKCKVRMYEAPSVDEQ